MIIINQNHDFRFSDYAAFCGTFNFLTNLSSRPVFTVADFLSGFSKLTPSIKDTAIAKPIIVARLNRLKKLKTTTEAIIAKNLKAVPPILNSNTFIFLMAINLDVVNNITNVALNETKHYDPDHTLR